MVEKLPDFFGELAPSAELDVEDAMGPLEGHAFSPTKKALTPGHLIPNAPERALVLPSRVISAVSISKNPCGKALITLSSQLLRWRG